MHQVRAMAFSLSLSLSNSDRLTAIRPFGRSFCGILLKSFNYVEGRGRKVSAVMWHRHFLVACSDAKCRNLLPLLVFLWYLVTLVGYPCPRTLEWYDEMRGWWEEKERERNQNATSIPSPSSFHHWPAEDSTPIFPMAPKKAWEAVPVLAKILSCKYTAWCKIDFLH